jgi:hypothetical protein
MEGPRPYIGGAASGVRGPREASRMVLRRGPWEVREGELSSGRECRLAAGTGPAGRAEHVQSTQESAGVQAIGAASEKEAIGRRTSSAGRAERAGQA